MGSFIDGEWESICKLFSTESEITPNLLDYSPSTFVPPSDNFSYPISLNSFSHVSENDAIFGDISMSNDASFCMDFMVDVENDGSLSFMFNNNEASSANQISPSTKLTLKRKPNTPMVVVHDDKEENTNSTAVTKKKARISNHTQKGKRKRQAKSEDQMAPTVNAEEETGHTTQHCNNSEDESNDFEEINQVDESESHKSVSITSTGKKRASRGAATDPQSLYARRRRMRINERLKILQSLVPNGTKVDISTMLEEAFHYVKFMQLQIRLLSSDELWMYAPLAYNGLDVGAYRRLSPFIGL